MKSDFLTHLDKIYWPKEGLTKGDLLRYYETVAPWILPHLKNRPVSLKRYPEGIAKVSFFQKNLADHPAWIQTMPMQVGTKKVAYLLIQNQKSLLYAANLGSIELHPFFSRAQSLKYPDFLIFDLDPKGADFLKVIEVARAIHDLLEAVGVPSYPKTSGATGLHIAVPLGAKYSYLQAKQFAKRVATVVVDLLPHIATLERSVAKRGGKVYIDCQQNNLGHTVVAPYSVRARAKAPVSTPLQWSEVKKGLDPTRYTLQTVLKRLKKWGDLYAPVLGKGIDLKKVMQKISKHLQ